MKVSVVGAGYVGLVTGACFAETGHDVRVRRRRRGQGRAHQPGRGADLRARPASACWRGTSASGCGATTDLRTAVLAVEITFIAVGHALRRQRIDLTYVREAARQIGAVLRDKPDYHVVVVKSTVVPGTTDEVVLPDPRRGLRQARRRRLRRRDEPGVPDRGRGGRATSCSPTASCSAASTSARTRSCARALRAVRGDPAAAHQQQDRRDDQVRLERAAGHR